MGTDGMHLGQNGYVIRFAQAHCRPKACQAPSYDENVVITHTLRHTNVYGYQRRGDDRCNNLGEPEEPFHFPVSKIDRNSPQTVDAVKCEKHEEQYVKGGLPVQAQGPVGLRFFREEKVTGKQFYSDKNDEGQAADSMKQ